MSTIFTSMRYTPAVGKLQRSQSTVIRKSLIEILWLQSKYFHFTEDERFIEYDLSVLQRVFLTLESPQSCLIAEFISLINILAVLLSVTTVIISTLRSLQHIPLNCPDPACDNDPNLCPGTIMCAPVPLHSFTIIETACVIFFTIDLSIRLLLCGIMPTRLSGAVPDYWDELEKIEAIKEHRSPESEPKMSIWMQYLRYMASFHFVADFFSILPTYIVLGSGNTSGFNYALVRVLRLLRVFRLLKLNTRGRMIVELLHRTMMSSREAIMILLFYLAIIIVFFATLIFTVESGVYTVNEDYPQGEYLRPDASGGKTTTPFHDIPSSVYYTCITIFTIGYGDMYPTTIAGRALACVCGLLSILVLALPITIIGNNFSNHYEQYVVKVQRMSTRLQKKTRMLMKKLLLKPNAVMQQMMDDSYVLAVRRSLEETQNTTNAMFFGLMNRISPRNRRGSTCTSNSEYDPENDEEDMEDDRQSPEEDVVLNDPNPQDIDDRKEIMSKSSRSLQFDMIYNKSSKRILMDKSSSAVNRNPSDSNESPFSEAKHGHPDESHPHDMTQDALTILTSNTTPKNELHGLDQHNTASNQETRGVMEISTPRTVMKSRSIIDRLKPSPSFSKSIYGFIGTKEAVNICALDELDEVEDEDSPEKELTIASPRTTGSSSPVSPRPSLAVSATALSPRDGPKPSRMKKKSVKFRNERALDEILSLSKQEMEIMDKEQILDYFNVLREAYLNQQNDMMKDVTQLIQKYRRPAAMDRLN